MFGRWLFPAVLIAAVAVPYFATRETSDGPLASWWNSMGTTQPGIDGSPLSTNNRPTPTRLASQRRLALPEANYLPSAANTLSPILPPDRSGVATPPTGPDGTTNPRAVPGDFRAGELGTPQQVQRPRPPALSIGGPPVQSLADLLRFDITPQWVVSRWPRVSTQLAETDLQGLRVPMVSGTRIQDLTGSLTYYFDRQQKVQRIGFQGHTGDPTQMIATLTQLYGLQPEPALGGGMYVARVEGKTTSVLRIRYAPVIRSSDPRGSHAIRFELNRPDSDLGREMQAVLRADLRARQWRPPATEKSATDAEVGPPANPNSVDNGSVQNEPSDGFDPAGGAATVPQNVAGGADPGVPAATDAPPGTSPTAPAGVPGPRWPYPGARHDRGF